MTIRFYKQPHAILTPSIDNHTPGRITQQSLLARSYQTVDLQSA